MEVNTNNYCRLCLKESDHFQIVNDTHREILNTFTLTLDLAISHEPVICKQCTQNLHVCMGFKNSSQNVLDDLIVFLNGQAILVDTCLFCKKSMVFSCFVFLNSEQLDILLLRTLLEQYFPELKLNAKIKPAICLMCYEPLQKMFYFIINCLSMEEQIKKYCKNVGTNSKGQVELKYVSLFMAGGPVDNKDHHEGSSILKAEENCAVNIREDNENDLCSRNVKVEDKQEKIILPDIIKVEGIFDDEQSSDNAVNQMIKFESTDGSGMMYKNEEFEINDDLKIEETCMTEESYHISQAVDHVREAIEAVVIKWANYGDVTTEADVEGDVNIESCQSLKHKSGKSSKKDSDKSKKKGGGRQWWFDTVAVANSSPRSVVFSKAEVRSMISHITISGEKRYQCQICQFISRAKCSMNRHMENHQDPSELPVYECHACSYKVKAKWALRKHVQLHRNNADVTLYKCEHCPLKTRHKNTIRAHQAVHKEALRIMKFECYHCSFKAASKDVLRHHIQKTHMRSKAKLLQCDKCLYKTNVEAFLRSHQLTHKAPSEPTTYQCFYCEFKTNFKTSCLRHMRNHREPLRCNICNFQAKYHQTFRKHLRDVHSVLQNQVLKA